jgi:hypothetical protein
LALGAFDILRAGIGLAEKVQAMVNSSRAAGAS